MPGSETSVRRWQFAPFAEAAGRRDADEALEAVHRRAFEDGHAAGLRVGRAAAEAQAKRLAEMVASAEAALRLAEERVAGELLDLAVELARQILRAELSLRRDAVLPVVRDALAQLAKGGEVRIAAHPADAALLREHLAAELARHGWTVLEDARIEPGGVRITTSAGDLDATLATRWRRVLSAIGQDHEWARADER